MQTQIVKCEFCDKNFSTLQQLSGHLSYCKERRIKLNLPQRKCWNKGLTKETDKRTC